MYNIGKFLNSFQSYTPAHLYTLTGIKISKHGKGFCHM